MFGFFAQFKAIVRAEFHALSAMNAYMRLTGLVEINGIHGAGLGAQTATDALPHLDDHPAALALGKGSSGTGQGAGCGLASQAEPSFKAGGKAPAGSDSNPGREPGKFFVHEAGAGQGT